MATQDIIIFKPSTSEETEALKAFGKALKLKFKTGESGENIFNQEIEIPESHKEIVAERFEDYQKNPQTNMDFDAMIKEIRAKYSL